MPEVRENNDRTPAVFKSLRELAAREKERLIAELLQVKGLVPLLMKPRNKQHWTAEDRAQLGAHLKRLSKMSPYLVVLVAPGGFLMLPALAWWLDRRRNRRGFIAMRR